MKYIFLWAFVALFVLGCEPQQVAHLEGEEGDTVTGPAGQDGEDGADGQDGTDGQDGKDAVFTDGDGDGYTEDDGDCDDTDVTIYPGAPETPDDGIDQDCDGSDMTVDTGDTEEPLPLDADGDGYDETEDCDDTDPEVHPGADDSVDGVDTACNGGPEMMVVLAGTDTSWSVDGETWTFTDEVSSTTTSFSWAAGETLAACAWGEGTPSVEVLVATSAVFDSSGVDDNGAYCWWFLGF